MATRKCLQISWCLCYIKVKFIKIPYNITELFKNKQTNKQKTRFRIQWHIQRVLNTGILVWAPTLSVQINEKQLWKNTNLRKKNLHCNQIWNIVRLDNIFLSFLKAIKTFSYYVSTCFYFSFSTGIFCAFDILLLSLTFCKYFEAWTYKFK